MRRFIMGAVGDSLTRGRPVPDTQTCCKLPSPTSCPLHDKISFAFARRALTCADANGSKTVQHALALNPRVRAARSPKSRHVLLRADGS